MSRSVRNCSAESRNTQITGCSCLVISPTCCRRATSAKSLLMSRGKGAVPRSSKLKVSNEFTVPLLHNPHEPASLRMGQKFLEHDLEKHAHRRRPDGRVVIFRKDHAQTKS